MCALMRRALFGDWRFGTRAHTVFFFSFNRIGNRNILSMLLVVLLASPIPPTILDLRGVSMKPLNLFASARIGCAFYTFIIFIS